MHIFVSARDLLCDGYEENAYVTRGHTFSPLRWQYDNQPMFGKDCWCHYKMQQIPLFFFVGGGCLRLFPPTLTGKTMSQTHNWNFWSRQNYTSIYLLLYYVWEFRGDGIEETWKKRKGENKKGIIFLLFGCLSYQKKKKTFSLFKI